MPVDPNAEVTVSAFNWVPDFARGLVRDLRVRWALEEAGIPYKVRKFDPRIERPADYLAEQPFGQVPAYRDKKVAMFESGAIVLHIGEESEALLPRDPQGRARAASWVLAALNSVEPPVQHFGGLDFFHAGESWVQEAKAAAEKDVRKRFDHLAAHLGDGDWLEDRFTAGDLLMVSVLRILRKTDLVAEYPALAAYRARGEARPAFRRALEAQLADFEELAPAA